MTYFSSRKRRVKGGFTLLELCITLVAGVILMMGMLPLIRMATQQGAAVQLQTRDLLELQSLVERLSAWADGQAATTIESTLGNAGEKTGFATVGDFYLHAAQYVHFDSNNVAQASATSTDSLEVRVGLVQHGPSISKIFGD